MRVVQRGFSPFRVGGGSEDTVVRVVVRVVRQVVRGGLRVRLYVVVRGRVRDGLASVVERNCDTAWYSVVDGEWPLLHELFLTWLVPESFREGGRQRRSLTELRGRLGGLGSEADGH